MTEWPKLSETLVEPKHPHVCQCCGAGPSGLKLERWQECDQGDRPTPVVVVLCVACSGVLIEPHPRLYRRLQANEPLPGSMTLCVGCRHRDGVRCAHPDAKANGGGGVILTLARPIDAFVCRRGKGQRSGWERIWPGPVTACKQRED